MNVSHWLVSVLGSAVVCVLTWASCQWWYGRKLAAMICRLEKIDKARQLSSQQTLQARKQIEKLQTDLAAQHRAKLHVNGFNNEFGNSAKR